MKDETVYLRHILDCIARIEEYTKDGRVAFDKSHLIQDATLRNLEVIGEAVRNLSDEFRSTHPDIPWTQIAGLRNVLIHQYFGVRLDTVWNVVEKDIPDLRVHVEAMLRDPS